MIGKKRPVAMAAPPVVLFISCQLDGERKPRTI